MPESRLHEARRARGQSVWFDTLSRDLVSSGELKRMMKDDAVTGVTSNPTIFQKALSQGNAYDEQFKELFAETDDATEIFFAARARRHPRRVRRPSPRRTTRAPWDGFVSMEVLPDARVRHRGDVRAGALDREGGRPAEPPREDPGDAARPAGDRGLRSRTARSINITLIFSLERYKAVVEAYLRGLERLVAGGGDPSKVSSVASFFVSRVDTEADKRLAALGNDEAPGQARDREREARVRALRRDVPGRALGVPQGQGRATAASALGVDVDEEPRLPRRDVRRGADRPRHREHDAARDDRGVPGSRRGARRHGGEGRRRGARTVFADLAAAGVDYDDVDQTLEQEGVQKFADSFAELLDGVRAKRETVAA